MAIGETYLFAIVPVAQYTFYDTYSYINQAVSLLSHLDPFR